MGNIYLYRFKLDQRTFLLENMFSSATANFEQFERVDGGDTKQWVRRASTVQGLLQENGDFVFYVDEGLYRKLVRTTNSGNILSGGYLKLLAINWEDSASWRSAEWYKVTKFFPSAGISFDSCNLSTILNIIDLENSVS